MERDTSTSYAHIYVMDFKTRKIYHGRIATIESVEEWLENHGFDERTVEVMCNINPINGITEI